MPIVLRMVDSIIVGILRWQDGRMASWHDGKMSRWQDGKLARWQGEKEEFFSCSMISSIHTPQLGCPSAQLSLPYKLKEPGHQIVIYKHL